MSAQAEASGPIPPSRALERIERRLPARRPAQALVALGMRALPTVASSVAAGVAVLAADRAVRSLVQGAAQRALGLQPTPPAQQQRPPATVVYSEWTIIERVRYRR